MKKNNIFPPQRRVNNGGTPRSIECSTATQVMEMFSLYFHSRYQKSKANGQITISSDTSPLVGIEFLAIPFASD